MTYDARRTTRDAVLILGILNLTPDSFSDGASQATTADFIVKARQLIKEGAGVLDIGGESTRPHASPVDLKEERRRVLPFLRRFREEFPDFPISLDTKKYELACEASEFGVQFFNDVSFLSDLRFLELAQAVKAYYILMHSRGDAQTMMSLTDYGSDTVAGILKEVKQKLARIKVKKFPKDRLILDPGFGFAKMPEQCVQMIECLAQWRQFGYPLLFAISRKRFLQHYTGTNQPQDRDEISAQLAVKAVQNGFSLIRTHNVALTRRYLLKL